jgi:hypothetical protein
VRVRIESSVIEHLVGQTENLHRVATSTALSRRIDVAAELDALRRRLSTQIDAHLQPWFVLLDESIQFFVQFERFLYEAPMSSELTAYAVTISKLKRDVISIRELLAIGQDTTARVLARTFVEDIEIAMALALSADTCKAFATTDDTNDFWNRHIGYGRVYQQVHDYLLACGVEDERARQLVDRHRDAKKLFSEPTHGGRQSSLMSAFAPSLTEPDRVHFLSLGALTYVTPQLALFIAQETQAFAGSVAKGLTVREPLHLYRGFLPTGQHMNAVAAAYVLQELLVRYEAELEAIEASQFA